MTSDYVTMSIKLCPVVGNNEYIIVCDFVGRRMGGFEVLEGGLVDPHPTPPTPLSKEAKKPCLNRVT